MLRFSLRPWRNFFATSVVKSSFFETILEKAFNPRIRPEDRQLSRERLREQNRENMGSLLPPSPVLRDIHDLVFEYEQVGPVLPSQPHHVLVVVFDPSSDHFPVRQLDTHQLLLLAQ